jgi:hypothetical protein
MGGMCCGVCAGRRGAAVGEWVVVVVVVVSRVRRWVVELCCAVLWSSTMPWSRLRIARPQ